MNTKTLAYRLLAGLVLITILAGCSPATPTPAPTADMQATLAVVQDNAVKTVVAQMTANAPKVTDTPVATNTPPATNTPAPTNTPAATNTPMPTATATRRPFTATPAFTATSDTYSCQVTSVSPKNTDQITAGSDFDGNWTVKNTGSKTWTNEEMDITYSSGQKFQKRGDVVDLPSDVASGSSITIIVDMKAPDAAGTYTTTWTMQEAGNVTCSLNLTVKVVK